MDKRTKLIIILCAVGITLAAAGLVWHFVLSQDEGEVMELNEGNSTNGAFYFEDDVPTADPLMVGKWRNTGNPQWYKVYYDDYDADGYFWGKEWDESEDVQEEDLNYHGNGWFRWKKEGTELIELATMDRRDVPIAKTYSISLSTKDSLVYRDTSHKRFIYRFGRVQ